MEIKWFMIAIAVCVSGLCAVGVADVYSSNQVKIAHEQTQAQCYEAAKTNPNIRCDGK